MATSPPAPVTVMGLPLALVAEKLPGAKLMEPSSDNLELAASCSAPASAGRLGVAVPLAAAALLKKLFAWEEMYCDCVLTTALGTTRTVEVRLSSTLVPATPKRAAT